MPYHSCVDASWKVMLSICGPCKQKCRDRGNTEYEPEYKGSHNAFALDTDPSWPRPWHGDNVEEM